MYILIKNLVIKIKYLFVFSFNCICILVASNGSTCMYRKLGSTSLSLFEIVYAILAAKALEYSKISLIRVLEQSPAFSLHHSFLSFIPYICARPWTVAQWLVMLFFRVFLTADACSFARNSNVWRSTSSILKRVAFRRLHLKQRLSRTLLFSVPILHIHPLCTSVDFSWLVLRSASRTQYVCSSSCADAMWKWTAVVEELKKKNWLGSCASSSCQIWIVAVSSGTCCEPCALIREGLGLGD